MKAIRSFEMSGTDYPVTQSHISDKPIPQPNRCEKLKTRKSMPAGVCTSKTQQETCARFWPMLIRPSWMAMAAGVKSCNIDIKSPGTLLPHSKHEEVSTTLQCFLRLQVLWSH